MVRTILDEVPGFRHDFIERQLAHAVRNPNGLAYSHTAFLPEWRVMMQTWADQSLRTLGSRSRSPGAVATATFQQGLGNPSPDRRSPTSCIAKVNLCVRATPPAAEEKDCNGPPRIVVLGSE